MRSDYPVVAVLGDAEREVRYVAFRGRSRSIDSAPSEAVLMNLPLRAPLIAWSRGNSLSIPMSGRTTDASFF